ncbi:hypothetical protein D3C72_2332090 [compost metagenome]
MYGVLGAEETAQAGKGWVIQFDHLLGVGQRVVRQCQSQLLEGQHPRQWLKVSARQHRALQVAFTHVADRLLRTL